MEPFKDTTEINSKNFSRHLHRVTNVPPSPPSPTLTLGACSASIETSGQKTPQDMSSLTATAGHPGIIKISLYEVSSHGLEAGVQAECPGYKPML